MPRNVDEREIFTNAINTLQIETSFLNIFTIFLI